MERHFLWLKRLKEKNHRRTAPKPYHTLTVIAGIHVYLTSINTITHTHRQTHMLHNDLYYEL